MEWRRWHSKTPASRDALTRVHASLCAKHPVRAAAAASEWVSVEEDGGADTPVWLDKELGQIRQKWVVSKSLVIRWEVGVEIKSNLFYSVGVAAGDCSHCECPQLVRVTDSLLKVQ